MEFDVIMLLESIVVSLRRGLKNREPLGMFYRDKLPKMSSNRVSKFKFKSQVPMPEYLLPQSRAVRRGVWGLKNWYLRADVEFRRLRGEKSLPQCEIVRRGDKAEARFTKQKVMSREDGVQIYQRHKYAGYGK